MQGFFQVCDESKVLQTVQLLIEFDVTCQLHCLYQLSGSLASGHTFQNHLLQGWGSRTSLSISRTDMVFTRSPGLQPPALPLPLALGQTVCATPWNIHTLRMHLGSLKS